MKKIKIGILLSVLAILISSSTLLVYLYQANLMQKQIKMSVWPFISVGPSWGPDRYEISITNKGIGPAIIEDVKFFWGDQLFFAIQDLIAFAPNDMKAAYTYASVYPGMVIMAGEDLSIFSTRNEDLSQFLQNDESGGFSILICYSSVYGDFWVSDGNFSQESDGNNYAVSK